MMPSHTLSPSSSKETRRSSRDEILAPQEIHDRVAQGQTIVIYEDYVLRLDSWLDKHPGGRLAILHMVGKDATDEIVAYHPDKTLQRMKAFRIGRRPVGPWMNMTPPIRGGLLHDRLQEPAAVVDLGDTTATSLENQIAAVAADGNEGLHYRGASRGLRLPESETDLDAESVISSTLRSRASSASGSPPPSSVTSVSDISDGLPPKCPAKFVDWAVEQGVDKCLEEYPSLDIETQQAIRQRYRQLHQSIIDDGLYECRYTEYMKELARYTTLFVLFLGFLRYGWYKTSAAFLGLFWHQIMFTAHDAGHRAITHNFVLDTLLGIFIADFCCGLSIGWWKSSHNVHHLVTNMPEHDPDIQNLPLFATCPSFFRSLVSTYYDNFTITWDAAAELLVPYQQYTYYPVMAIARFNLYVLSWLHVLSSKSSGLGSTKAWWIRPTEIAGMVCYWFVFGYCLVWCTIPTWLDRVLFVVISHVVLMPLHVQINLSHWGMSTSDPSNGQSESFAQSQLRTTMDVDCPAWLDFVHGGLQFQAVHHLFPRIPRHNLRRAQAHVRHFCADTGIPYSILGFVDGNRKVLGRLGEVSEQVRMMVNCQKSMAEAGEMGL